MAKRVLGAMLIAAVSAGCLPVELPPPSVPERVLPAMPDAAAPPAAGEGQVAIATADGEPAQVEEVTGRYEGVTADGTGVAGQTFRTVCTKTPCVGNLTLGDHELLFTSLADAHHGGSGHVAVGVQPTAYNYALGHNTDPSVGKMFGGIYLLTFGGLALVGGAVMIGLGKVDTAGDMGSQMAPPDLTPYGLGAVAVGAGLMALAAYMLHGTGATTQPGTGVQWTPTS